MVGRADAGWEANKQLHSGYRSAKPDSPGYTPEQHEQVNECQAELLAMLRDGSFYEPQPAAAR
ncbi:hypothetical protein [Streptomyces sp. NPDC057689]|uniref:hypothetical protein n=1 Tax=Streptomyces sp. NPDC057689 TaxID=3346213 RepID=UPI003686D7E2